MDKKLHDNKLALSNKKLKRQERINIILVVALLVNSCLAIAGYNKERIVMLPPEIRNSFWVSSEHASDEYLQEWSMFFVQLANNVSPSNIDDNNKRLLSYVSPTQLSSLKAKLDNDAVKIKRDQVTMAFYAKAFHIDGTNQKVVVDGVLNTMLTDKIISSQNKSYRISYAIENGKLYVEEFGEVNADNPFGEYKTNDNN